MASNPGGRPSIGGYRKIPLGEGLVSSIDDWATQHRYTFNQSVRELIAEGLAAWPGERILIDQRGGLLGPGGALHDHADNYREAIHHEGSITRAATCSHAEHPRIQLVSFRDPLTQQNRFAVLSETAQSVELRDYPHLHTAKARYERDLDTLAADGYTLTDTIGDTPPPPSDRHE